MTARQEILVVCLVESSVALLHEWGAVLVRYLSPLLQRIAAGGVIHGSRNEFRIGFISYSDPYIHPNPILAKRFFSPPFQLTKELKDDPASLGLGRTASGSRRGMAILEGYVSVLEMFDAAVDTRAPQPLRPQFSSEPQQDPLVSESTCYLIHIASSPPNKATRPTWNMNPALDTVTWESLPSHLLKRKIRTTMILTRPIVELQDLYNSLSLTPEPFWLSIVRPCHKLLLSGLPPLKDKAIPQKRAAADNPEPPIQPARPHPPEHNLTLPPTNSILTPSAVPITSSGPASAIPIKEQALPPSQPQSQPQLPTPTQSRPHISTQNIDPVKLLSFIRTLEVECRNKLAAITQARDAGNSKAKLEVMQNDLNQKLLNRHKLMTAYHQIVARRQQQVSGALDSTAGGQSTQQVPQNSKPGQIHTVQEQPAPHELHQSAAVSGSTQPNVAPDTLFTALGGASTRKSPFQGIPISSRPGMETQMQKMLAERARIPMLTAAPQSQPPPQDPVQPTQGNTTTGSNANQQIVDIMTPRVHLGPHARRWQGVLAWPSANNGTRKENQIAIALFTQNSTLQYESWPQKLFLHPSRALFNMATIQAWNKESNPVMGLISHTPIIGNFEATAQNMRQFRQLRELIYTKNMLAYCNFDIAGGPPGTGLLAFTTNAQLQGDILVAMVFNKTPLPTAVTGNISMRAPATDTGISSDVPSMGSGPTSPVLQNTLTDTMTLLQQQQAAVLAAYHQQHAVALAAYNQQAGQHQQLQQTRTVSNPGGNSSSGSAPNMTQFTQNLQRTRWNSDV